MESLLRRHTYPAFGERRISSIIPSEIQAWVTWLGTPDPAAKRAGLAPHTVGVLHSIVASIMRPAVRDRKIPTNPCEGTKLPKVPRRLLMPLSTAQGEALRDGVPDELRALVVLAAGTGMRQGEIFGLTRDRLRLLGRDPAVVIDRQLIKLTRTPAQVGPPKTNASDRTVPLPRAVVAALNQHLAERDIGNEDLVFTLDGRPLNRASFGHVWRPVALQVGLTESTGTGMHSLRHYYASLLIRYGESVKTVQSRLGHASASETLDTYSHMWPDSDDRTREAIDAVLGGGLVIAPGQEGGTHEGTQRGTPPCGRGHAALAVIAALFVLR